MTSTEYAQFVLHRRKEITLPQTVDPVAACEVGELLSGSFTYITACAPQYS